MLTMLSGDHHCTAALSKLGLKVFKTCEDAPKFVKSNAAHLMKHWMNKQLGQAVTEMP